MNPRFLLIGLIAVVALLQCKPTAEPSGSKTANASKSADSRPADSKTADSKAGEINYPDNTFRRVVARDGLKLRSGPDEKSRILVVIPRRSHVRLLRTRNRPLELNGRKGRRAYISWNPMTRLKMSKPSYEGWTYSWNLGSAKMKITPALFRDFKSGCLGDGCFICGNPVFDPDGRFHNSFDCHTPPERGRWVANGDVLLACAGTGCDPAAKPLYRFRVREGKIVAECAAKKCPSERMPLAHDGISYWEPHDFQ